jgi:hypothetical protein
MIEQRNTQFNERQFALMESQVRRYKDGEISLASLISALEALVHSLESVEDSWIARFQREWGVLEELYSVALDRVERGVSASVDSTISEPDSSTSLDAAIDGIRKLLAERRIASTPLEGG